MLMGNCSTSNPVIPITQKMADSTLLDGNYKAEANWYNIMLVDGGKALLKESMGKTFDMNFKYGEFGEAHPEIVEAMGKEMYNVEFSYSAGGDDFTELGVIAEDGLKVMTKGMMGISKLEWMTEEEAAAFEAEGDPIDAPTCPYELQPDNLGKLVWITGPPCSGKSVSAQMLGKNAGYVYYEGDAYGSGRNPYVPLDAEDPSMATFTQKPLKGEGLEERSEIGMKSGEIFAKKDENEEEWTTIMTKFYEMMCDDIDRERKRVGGDWVIATVACTQTMRAVIRYPYTEMIIISQMRASQVQVRIRPDVCCLEHGP